MNNPSSLRAQFSSKYSLSAQENILNEIYIFNSQGEYDKAFRLGDDLINNTKIHSSPYSKTIILQTADAAYKSGKSNKIVLHYLDIYVEIFDDIKNTPVTSIFKNSFMEYLSTLDEKSLSDLVKSPSKAIIKITEGLVYQKNPKYAFQDYLVNKSYFGSLLYQFVEFYPEVLDPIYKTSVEFINNENLLELERIFFLNKLYLISYWIMDYYIKNDRVRDAEKLYETDVEYFKEFRSKIFNNKLLSIEKYLIDEDYESAEKELSSNIDLLSNKELLYLLISESVIYSYQIALANFVKYSENLEQEKQMENTIWYDLSDMFMGKVSPLKLIENLKSNNNFLNKVENLCIANCFIGIKYMFEGNDIVAKQYFSQSISMDTKYLLEYNIAKNKLENTIDINLQVNKDMKTIAVLDFEADGFTSTEAKVITKRFASNLNNRNIFNMLERAEMEEIIKEQKFQLSGCTTSECAVEVGQLLGVQLMLAGSIGRFGDINILEVRIIDIETGKIVKTASVDIMGKKELLVTEGVKKALDILSN